MSSRYLVRDILAIATKELSNIDRPQREAQLLLMHYLEVDELYLLTNQQALVEIGDDFFDILDRRANFEPLEYITKKVSFYSNEFYVDYGVLIPRPESELLIDEVLRIYPDTTRPLVFCEVGVGSGIISIILAKLYPNAKILALDISPKALQIAKTNIEAFGVASQITLQEGNLLNGITQKIDYLISNPPYIAEDFVLEPNLAYEPREALFGGKIGDEIIKELLDEVLKREISFFTCEIGYDQKDKITQYLNVKPYKELSFYKDLSGFDRGFTLRR